MKNIARSRQHIATDNGITDHARATLAVGAVSLVIAAGLSATEVLATVSASAAPATKVSLVLILDDLTNPVELPLRVGAMDAAKHYGFSLKIVGPSPATASATDHASPGRSGHTPQRHRHPAGQLGRPRARDKQGR